MVKFYKHIAAVGMIYQCNVVVFSVGFFPITFEAINFKRGLVGRKGHKISTIRRKLSQKAWGLFYIYNGEVWQNVTIKFSSHVMMGVGFGDECLSIP